MITTIYKTLLKQYGKQHWWPVTPPGENRPQYTGGPKTEQNKIEIAFGAILSQNTTWTNVEKALVALNENGLVDVDGILTVPRATLARLIRPSRYFNQKAIKLKALAQLIRKHPLKTLQAMQAPKLRELLLGVNGIGPETADSIVLYAFGKPVFVVDAYTRRIFSRMGLCTKTATYNELQELFHTNCRRNQRVFSEYHALLVVHGGTICRPKPRCNECVLNARCKKLLE